MSIKKLFLRAVVIAVGLGVGVAPGDVVAQGESTVATASTSNPQPATGFVAYFESTAPTALPGHSFLIILEVHSSKEIPNLNLEFVLPEGWNVQILGPCGETLPCPLPAYAGASQRIPLVFKIPNAAAGIYSISVKFLPFDQQETLKIKVWHCLEPIEVVRHWDVERGEIDLSREGRVTYERLLWAVAHLGQKIPYTCRSLQPTDIEALVTEWCGL